MFGPEGMAEILVKIAGPIAFILSIVAMVVSSFYIGWWSILVGVVGLPVLFFLVIMFMMNC